MIKRALTAIRYYLRTAGHLKAFHYWPVLPLRLLIAMVGKRTVTAALKTGLTFRIRSPMDLWIVMEVVVARDYERYVAVAQGDMVIDIGAGIGDFTISVASRANRVIAVEPDPGRLVLLRENLLANDVKNVIVLPLAAKNLHDLLTSQGISRCDFLKIDCEGCEYGLLNEGGLDAIDAVAAEVHRFVDHQNDEFEKLYSTLEESGFEVHYVPNPVHSETGLIYARRLGQARRT